MNPLQKSSLRASDLPSARFQEWWQGSAYLQNARIVGRSLKYIRSRLPRVDLELPEPDFLELQSFLQKGGSLGGADGHAEPSGQIRLDLAWEDTSTGQPWLCRVFALGQHAKGHALQFSFEELYLPPGSDSWQGPAYALRDLQENRLGPSPDAPWPAPPLSPEALLGSIILSAQLDMQMPEALWELLEESYDEAAMQALSKKKLGKFFKKLMLARKPSRAFLVMQKIGILDWFLPELAKGAGLEQNRYHLHDIFYHSIYTCDAVEVPDLGLRLAALFHDLGKVDTRREKGNGEASFHNHEMVSVKHAKRILYRFGLGYNKPLLERVVFLVRNHMFHYTQEWTDKAIRRFIQKVGTHQLEDLIALRLADRKGSGKKSALPRAIKDMMRHIEEVRRREAEPKVRDLKIGGHDLMELGLQPGPIMGEILGKLLEEVKAGQLENEFPSLQKRCLEIIQELGASDKPASDMPAKGTKDSPGKPTAKTIPQTPTFQTEKIA